MNFDYSLLTTALQELIVKAVFSDYPYNMEKDYQVITGKNSRRFTDAGIQAEEPLAVGIMDTGKPEALEKTLRWYSENFNYQIHVITYSANLENSDISSRYSNATFIVFPKAPSLAQRINALANECVATYFLVTRTDVDMEIFNCIQDFRSSQNTVMITPLVFNSEHELIPTVRAPHIDRKEIDSLSFLPSKGKDENLYPFLGLGLYNRSLFQKLRGYDEQIKGAYWQLLDFGTRCWLYGYNIYSVNSMVISFPGRQSLMEDRSECEGIERFYTKALCVTIGRNGIPKVRRAYRTDKKFLANEVKPRASLYKNDFQTLCAFWKNPDKD